MSRHAQVLPHPRGSPSDSGSTFPGIRHIDVVNERRHAGLEAMTLTSLGEETGTRWHAGSTTQRL